MLKDITLGQYFPVNSIIHDLDPRIKIISTLIFMIIVFVANTVFSFALILAFTLAVIFLSKIKLINVIKAIKPVLFIVLFTAIINLFLTDGDDILFKWGFLKITKAGFYAACIMAARITLLVATTSLLTFTTSPILLTDGIEKLLNPFSKMGLPAHELAMMMTIALRFIPTLLEETDKIIMAQKARGADFESGNILKRSKALVPILVPLFISSFRRADELATAMECRCYRGGEKRTRLREIKIKSKDILAFFIMIMFSVTIIFLGAINI